MTAESFRGKDVGGFHRGSGGEGLTAIPY